MSKQCEFDFEQYQEPRRTYAKPVTDYFRRAFGFEMSAAPVQPAPVPAQPILSTDSAERKQTPIYSGLLAYFPLAIAAVSRHSKRGNDQHNKGQPLHWAREKSTDHLDCCARHLVDANHFDVELNEYTEACALAWRALAHLQLLEERRLGRSPQESKK